MKKILLIASIMLLGTASYAGDSWCKVSTNSQHNKGYCTEGIDGTGKCLSMAIENASKCSDDQPDLALF